MFTIRYGEKSAAEVDIRKFPAMEGWVIQQDFVKFAETDDMEFRRAYTLRVLSYASVISGSVPMPLSTDALIDNHLRSWENVKAVFEEVLMVNGIDPKTHADRSEYWERVGQKLAIAFIAEASKILGPGLNMAAENFLKVEGE